MMGRVLHMMNGNRGKGVICVFLRYLCLYFALRVYVSLFCLTSQGMASRAVFVFFGGHMLFLHDYLSHQLQ